MKAKSRLKAQVEERFVLSGDDMVVDRTTGLTWSRSVLAVGTRNWKDSLKACAKCRLGGHSDWRAPTIAERLAINDYERYAPALNPIFISETYGWEWTATPYKASPAVYAWVVGLGGGDSNIYGQDGDYFVRAVRSSTAIG